MIFSNYMLAQFIKCFKNCLAADNQVKPGNKPIISRPLLQTHPNYRPLWGEADNGRHLANRSESINGK